MIGKITSVAVIGDKRLEIAWDDGHVAHVAYVDLSDVIAAHKAVAPLKRKGEFARVTVSADGWSIEWTSGIDFGAQIRWADEQAGEVMRVLKDERFKISFGFAEDIQQELDAEKMAA